MEEVLHYLDLKNQYYEKFHSVTVKFLESANRNEWESVEVFVDNRERILNIIRSYDFKVAEAFERADVNPATVDRYRPRVKALLDRRTELAARIVAIDLELISKMDEMKSDTIRELKKTVEKHADLGEFAAKRGTPELSS